MKKYVIIWHNPKLDMTNWHITLQGMTLKQIKELAKNIKKKYGEEYTYVAICKIVNEVKNKSKKNLKRLV